ncbi:hypothetical protein SDC9_98750 [bioreactor metagenome]|uniref:Uncharacterized protein n=1 Tax=bioreactor metagenome TaxID=1076179 RepID=A0A645AG55_9ZZZZ
MHGANLAGRCVGKGHGKAHSPVRQDGGEIIVFSAFEHSVIRDGAGRDQPYDFTFDKPFGKGRVLGLLTDGHFVALLHQACNIGVHAVVRHTAHGCPLVQPAIPTG